MNLQRVVLYVLLLFVSFKLFDLWTHRHDAQRPEINEVVQPNEAQQRIINSLEDIPSKYNRRPLSITTNVMKVYIDLKGARIVDIELLKYPQSTDAGSPPVHLFSQTDDHPFFATSGFIGDESVIFHSVDSGGDQNRLINKNGQFIRFKSAPTSDGLVYVKEFTFYPDLYKVDVTSTVTNESGVPQNVEYYSALMSKQQHTIDSESLLPDAKAFQAGEKADPKGMFVYNTYTGPSYTTTKKPYTKLSYQEASLQDQVVSGISNGWISIQKQYFLTAWMPQSTNPFVMKTQWYDSKKVDESNIHRQYFGMALSHPPVIVEPNKSTQQSSVLYAGPELVENLKGFNRHLELTVDYGWLWMVSNLLYRLMDFFHGLVHSWGLAIIFVTLLIKLVFYKLNEISFRSTAKMKKVAPQIELIKKNYENDPVAKNQAIMDLYRRENLNPLMGCLPLLLQMPIFFALYWVLMEAVHLRHASFLWLADLSTKDPFYILPLLMGVSLLIQQRMTPTSQDPSQKAMMYMFPIMFTLLFSQMPSGLVLYMLFNNVTSIMQQSFITRKLGLKAF